MLCVKGYAGSSFIHPADGIEENWNYGESGGLIVIGVYKVASPLNKGENIFQTDLRGWEESPQ